MESKKAPYHVNLVYDKYTREVASLTLPKFVSMGGVPIMRLTTQDGNEFGVNLNFVHRFEYNTTNKDKETKTDEQSNC